MPLELSERDVAVGNSHGLARLKSFFVDPFALGEKSHTTVCSAHVLAAPETLAMRGERFDAPAQSQLDPLYVVEIALP